MSNSAWINRVDRLAIYIRDNFCCQYCGTDLRDVDPSGIGLDHLVPRVRGGTHEATNLVTSCRHCNSSKGTQDYASFAPGGALARIEGTRHRPLSHDLAKATLKGKGPKWE